MLTSRDKMGNACAEGGANVTVGCADELGIHSSVGDNGDGTYVCRWWADGPRMFASGTSSSHGRYSLLFSDRSLCDTTCIIHRSVSNRLSSLDASVTASRLREEILTRHVISK